MLTITYTPGRVIAVGDIITEDVLNDLAHPTIELEGTVSASSLGVGSITTDKLADFILSADTLGRKKMADRYVTAIKLATAQDWSGFTLTGNPTVTWTGTIDFSGATLTLPAANKPAKYTNTSAALSAAGSYVAFAHGPLAGIPQVVRWTVVCKTTTGTLFSVDDEVGIESICLPDNPTNSDAIFPAMGCGANATHVWATLAPAIPPSGYYIVNRTTPGLVPFIPANWLARVTCIYYP